MKIVRSFPRPVREIENYWIPLSDGCRLAARLWLPEDAEAAPVPALLEYIPYRKRDFTRRRDQPMHAYFAGHGYAAVRVDIRGAGDSEGALSDEYSEQELDDAVEVIRWLAQQPWCTGAVGMMGISWGGFNSLQVAARQPPELKAIITLCASDDRYADDAHYMGGCLLNENLQWGAVLMTFNAYPPDPDIVGERWRTLWLERLQNAVLFPQLWLEHQHRDPYWKHGSVSEDYARIRCPVYAIGGWADGYSNAIPRLLAGLTVPRKGLIGPWAHVFPHDGLPGPAIGFLQEARRWWDHWLKGADTGIMQEPRLRAWMLESVPPRPFYRRRPGRWVAEASWPSPRIRERAYHLNPGRLGDESRMEAELRFSSPQTTGLNAGDWCGFGAEGEAPTGQREDDGKSLTFDSDALDERIEILGAPVVTLELSVDRPAALVAVRLNDVAPDGASTRVTYGLLNLTHRNGHEQPAPLVPGQRYRVRVKLNDVAYAFPRGHRLRVSISTGYWPVAWPSPEPVTLTLYTGASRLALPVRPPDPADDALREFDKPEQAPPLEHETLLHSRFKRTIERNLATNETLYHIFSDGDEFEGASLARLKAINLELGTAMDRHFTIEETNPLSAAFEIRQATLFRRGPWSVRVDTRARMTSTKEAFRIVAELKASEGNEVVFSRQWDRKIPRKLV